MRYKKRFESETMRLIQAKVRCVEGVRDTGWIVPGKETTVICGPSGSGKSHLMRALETLNPLYDVVGSKPFANHPKEWQQGNHTRRVIPEKKTAVFMVFSAEPDLVRELDLIDPVLIETDRIEVGRRLDYTRWITFVEIAASARWSEIAESMMTLSKVLPLRVSDTRRLTELQEGWAFLETLRKTDRVKDQTAVTCNTWLNELLPFLHGEELEIANSCLFKSLRAQRFITARKKVDEWLPPVIMVNRSMSLKRQYTFSELYSGKEQTDPIVLLLQRILRTYSRKNSGTGTLKGFNDVVLELNSNLEARVPVDVSQLQIRFGEDSVELTKLEAADTYAGRIQVIMLVSVLAELLSGRGALLLLDQIVDDLEEEIRVEMICLLQKIGRNCQMILTTSKADVASADGWQTVKKIGSGGLAVQGMNSG